MATTVHKNLTGADLHEPKGADTALSGQVYVANGAGSGVWTAASSIITNTAFTTGDLKPTHKNTADTGWIMWVEGTIGDASSGASLRANADTSALFQLYWNNMSDGDCPVVGGRGASAAADYAAHKKITLPRGPGRSLVVAGSGSGLTARTLGDYAGNEAVTLVAGNIPSLTSTGNNSISVSTSGTYIGQSSSTSNMSDFTLNGGSGARAFTGATAFAAGITATGTNSISVTYTNVSPTAISMVQPSAFVNVMIKL